MGGTTLPLSTDGQIYEEARPFKVKSLNVTFQLQSFDALRLVDDSMLPKLFRMKTHGLDIYLSLFQGIESYYNHRILHIKYVNVEYIIKLNA